MLPAIGAHGTQLEAVQAVDAAVAAGQVRGPQPGLFAGRADRSEVDVAHARVSLAMKKPSVRSRCGNVCRYCGMVGCFQTGRSKPRFVALKSGWESRKRVTSSSFSWGEIVQVEYTRVPPGLSAFAPLCRISVW